MKLPTNRLSSFVGALVFVSALASKTCVAAGAADEWTVYGNVTSTLCDAEGNPRQDEISPGISASNSCEFVWFRKGTKWRLDIKEPLAPFRDGVWHTIMPFTETELITIISCPYTLDDPKAGGNAIVKVITNTYVAAEDVYGAHAVWLSHNLEGVLTMVGASMKSPPFLDYDPAIHALQVPTHAIRRADSSVIWWNLGYYFARDESRGLIIEEGGPKLLPYPLLADTGFMEFELRISTNFMDERRQIPIWFALDYWVPFRDETKPSGVRFALHSTMTVMNKSFDARAIPEDVFLPTWTNDYATVTDFRAIVGSNQPLSYITKAKGISPGLDELKRRTSFDNTVRVTAQASRRSQEGLPSETRRWIVVALFCVVTAGLWFLWRRGRECQ